MNKNSIRITALVIIIAMIPDFLCWMMIDRLNPAGSVTACLVSDLVICYALFGLKDLWNELNGVNDDENLKNDLVTVLIVCSIALMASFLISLFFTTVAKAIGG